MASSQRDSPPAEELRREAEARVARARATVARPGDDHPDRLLHELQVHEIELEMQNDELRKAQAELEESRDRYWALYDHAPVGYLTLDREGKVLEANFTAAELLRVDRGALVGRRLSTFMSVADADTFHVHRRDVFSQATKQGCELRVTRSNGHVFPARLDSVAELESAPPSMMGNSQPARCRTVLIDLSEIRRAQDDVRTHESRTRTLLDTAADAIVSTDGQGRIESLNAAAEVLFGYREQEIRGQDIRTLLPTLSPGEERGYIGHTGRETIGLMKHGTTCPVEISVGEWWDRGSRKLTAIIRDIGARKQAERALQDSEARFRQIAEHIEDVFYVREASGIVSYVSPAFERIWGRPATDLAGNPSSWLRTIDAEDRQRVARAWERLREGSTISEIYRIRRPDGAVRWVHSRGFPVEGLDGKVSHNVGVVRDITSERRLEDELRQSQKLEAVGTLASGVAHNMRNVLQAVLSFIHVAQRTGIGAERGGQALARAVTTARRGSGLIDQLMVFTRKHDVVMKPLHVDALIREAAGLLAPLVGDQIRVEIETMAPDALVMGDPVQLEQILLNLATNARDAMPGGGTLVMRTEELVLDEQTAATHAVVGGPHVKIIVEDTGAGMDPATLAHIFEPFFTTKEVGKGTGLGLATVFALTRQFGGYIAVDSEKGKGTAFTLCFPALPSVVEASVASEI